MINRKAIADDLTDMFIQYQYSEADPTPPSAKKNVTATQALMREAEVRAYRSRPIFKAKVDDLVFRAMQIIDKHT